MPNASKQTVASSRDRLLDATARLLAERGFDGVGLAAIVKAAGTTTGSLYFHFPQGKEQLALAAMSAAAERTRVRIAATLAEAPDTVAGLHSLAALWADDLEGSDWKDGCPVAATMLQMSTRSEALRKAGHRALASWQAEIRAALVQDRGDSPELDRMAELALALLEGAELLARAGRSRLPLMNAREGLTTLLSH